MIKRKCGAMLSPIDERDYKYTDIAAGAGEPLPEKYVNPYLDEIAEIAIDQGDTLMCVPCAVSHLKWLIERKQIGNRKMFSPGYLYGNSAADDADEGGCYPRCVVSQAVKFGVPHLEDFPNMYESKPLANRDYKNNKERLDPLAYPYRGDSYYSCGIDIATIKRAIMSEGGVAACYKVYNSFYYPEDDSVINFKPSPINYGYHEVLLCGWDDEKQSFIMLNSWGNIYNDIFGSGNKKPYCYINYMYMPSETHTIIDTIKEGDFMFTDTNGHWAEKDIDKAANKGIVNGFEDGSFRPDEPVTRAQLCAILNRLGLT